MSFWKDNAGTRPKAKPSPDARDPARLGAPSRSEHAPIPGAAPVTRIDAAPIRKDSLIAADITIEGRIEGGGSVRIAGKFKGNVNLQGDLTIEAGARLTGGVRADNVTVAGELEGNIEQASHVDLRATGVVTGDLKAGSLTVAAGARMHGRVELGREESNGLRAAGHGIGYAEHSVVGT